MGWVIALCASACGADGSTSGWSEADADYADSGSDGSGDGCAADTLEGICLPEPPRGAATGSCPGGIVGDDVFDGGGICRPHLPVPDCLDGWSAVSVFADGPPAGWDDVVGCEPPPLPEDCPEGQMPLVGEAGCVAIGPACPSGGAAWPDEATLRQRAPGFEGRVIYVAPDGTDDGDGSRASPIGRIGRALGRADSGDIVALSVGTWQERAIVGGRVALVGACVTGTTLVAPVREPTAATVVVQGPGAESLIRDITITGEAPAVMARNLTRSNELRHVAVLEPRVAGVIAEGGEAGGELLVDSVHVMGVRADLGLAGVGVGLQSSMGASVTASRVTVVGTPVIGMAAQGDGTRFSVSEAFVAGAGSTGWYVAGGATAEAAGVVFEGHADGAVFVEGNATSAELRDAVVRNMARTATPEPLIRVSAGGSFLADQLVLRDGAWSALQVVGEGTEATVLDTMWVGGGAGEGAFVQDGARLFIRRGALIDLARLALGAAGEGSEIDAEDVWVAGVRASVQTQSLGAGLGTQDGAHTRLVRFAVSGAETGGLMLQSGDHQAIDLYVDDIVPGEDVPPGDLGVGVLVRDGAALDVERAAVERTVGVGVAVLTGSRLDVRDLLVRDVGVDLATGTFGYGISIESQSQADVQRVVVDSASSGGLFVGESGSALRGADVTVRDTRPSRLGGFGLGVAVQGGASVDVSGLHIGRQYGFGLVALGAGTDVRLRRLVVERTAAQACSGPDVSELVCAPGGIGVASVDGALVDLEAFAILDSALSGAMLGREGSMSARDGVIARNTIAVNLQTGVDLDDAFVDVRLRDNERDVATEELPVPAVPGATQPAP